MKLAWEATALLGSQGLFSKDSFTKTQLNRVPFKSYVYSYMTQGRLGAFHNKYFTTGDYRRFSKQEEIGE